MFARDLGLTESAGQLELSSWRESVDHACDCHPGSVPAAPLIVSCGSQIFYMSCSFKLWLFDEGKKKKEKCKIGKKKKEKRKRGEEIKKEGRKKRGKKIQGVFSVSQSDWG